MSDRDTVRDATDLVALISEYVKLEPKGREHVGLCPFHDDSKPSFHVVTHRNTPFYKCFACGESGDCYRFLMNHLNWSFPEALNHLAERAGITLERRGGGDKEAADERQLRRTWLRKALDQANTWFRETLDTPPGKAARDCIEARGISSDMVERFGLGAAPEGWNNLADALSNDAMPAKVLAAAGLLKEKDSRYYDAFRNRLIFPIHDDAGLPIAFGGRDLGDDGPKYLNSPEHDLFKKGRNLYGMHLARKSMRDAARAIVAEGYTDVIACHAAGFTETVGTLGTAFTDDHARLLQRNTNLVILLFDGDEAGRKAADRAVGVSMRHVLDVKICVLPDGLDPDDCLARPDGHDVFETALAGATDAISWTLDRSGIADAAPGSADRQQRVQRLLDELNRNGLQEADDMRRAFVLNRIADLAGVPLRVIQDACAGPRKARPAEPEQAAPVGHAQVPAVERELLAVALAALTRDLQATDVLDAVQAPPLRQVAEAALTVIRNGEPVDIPHLHDHLDTDEARTLATDLVESGVRILDTQTEFGTDAASALDRIAEQLQRRRQSADINMKISSWRGEGAMDVSQAADLLNELRAAGRRPDAIPRPAEG